jgi:peptide/nickel transport system substrate-binding protein
MIRVHEKEKSILVILALVGLLVLTAGLLSGCGGDDEPATTETPGGDTGTTDGDTGTTAPVGDATRGGVARIGSHAATNLDPHFSTSIADIMLNHQIYDWLVEIDENNQPSPGIATSWDSPDGQTWTFDIREGVTFHNGDELTAEDVVYTFDRLRDESIGSPLVGLYSGITEIEATSPTQVVFSLSAPNPEFPSDLGDYHAAILSRNVSDPKSEQVGTGPFLLDDYSAEDRAVLVKNDNYWKEGDDGQPLPYLDGVEFIFSPDLSGQVEALRGGELDFVGGLTSPLADTVKSDTNLQLLTVSSNMHYVIHMRSDEGPAADNRVRQALKLGTDHQALIDAVRPGLADVGNGFTPVGPSYGDYYLDEAPQPDVERARQLLEEAGFGDGLDITLTAQQALDIPDIATVWREQMAEIGVNVQIETVPPDVYYGEGSQSWLEVPFGITEWGTRATPVTYFKLAYITGGDYNESHWSDPEMDELTTQIDSELDREARTELYHQAQQIMIERGPVIVPYFESGVAGATASLQGVQLATDWARTLFTSAYMQQ